MYVYDIYLYITFVDSFYLTISKKNIFSKLINTIMHISSHEIFLEDPMEFMSKQSNITYLLNNIGY